LTNWVIIRGFTEKEIISGLKGARDAWNASRDTFKKEQIKLNLEYIDKLLMEENSPSPKVEDLRLNP